MTRPATRPDAVTQREVAERLMAVVEAWVEAKRGVACVTQKSIDDPDGRILEMVVDECRDAKVACLDAIERALSDAAARERARCIEILRPYDPKVAKMLEVGTRS